jgi:hypothetical protein
MLLMTEMMMMMMTVMMNLDVVESGTMELELTRKLESTRKFLEKEMLPSIS